MRRILITGSNRGIGLDLVQRYLQQADTLIFAACRTPARAEALNKLAALYPERLKIIPLDVADQASIAESLRLVSAQVDGLELLINNAGILPGGVADREPSTSAFGALEAGAMLEVFHINTVAPIMVAQAYADLLRKGNGARLINVSSDAGSITRRGEGCNYAYPASKAALNMLTRCLAGDFLADGVIAVSVHPGWIRTDMGGPDALFGLEDTIPGLMKVIDGLTLADSSRFYNWDGTLVPW